MKLFDVTFKQIRGLSDIHLTKVLLKLINSEAAFWKLKDLSIDVPLNIDVGDGGIDGNIYCKETNDSQYLQNNQIGFQCKATDINAASIFFEFFSECIPKSYLSTKTHLILKGGIKKLLDDGGQYIFFISKDYNPRQKDSRLKGATNAIDQYNSLYQTNYKHNQVRIIEGNTIANWANFFLESIIQIQEFNGMDRPSGLQLFSRIGDNEDFRDVKFQSNDKLSRHISRIESFICGEDKILRVIGHSGLGKTRLVYEAFKATARANSAAYYNITHTAQGIIDFFINYLRVEGIIVVDNCSLQDHRELRKLVKSSNSALRVITIDYNVAEEEDKSTNLEEYLFLNKGDYDGVVKSILVDMFSNKIEDSRIEQIAEYSEGYPEMAVLFAKAQRSGQSNMSEMLGDDLINKLVFGREYAQVEFNEKRFEILKACSIFSHFAFPEIDSSESIHPKESELYKRQVDLIRLKFTDSPVSIIDFRKAIEYFTRNKVLERRGAYLAVKPLPLAVKLATKWWKHHNGAELVQLFPELEELQLAVPLVNRLAELDQVKHAKNIVNDMWGINSPFGTAEVLNTHLGSQLFRSVAHVSPENALLTLESIFEPTSISFLRNKVGPGRSEIILTLAKLAFHKELFARSAMLLAKFALAENTVYANNATNQFLHLFKVYLPGTEADLQQRESFIYNLASIDNKSYVGLAFRAASTGLQGAHFIRHGGAESNGSSPILRDFHPEWSEISKYWEFLVQYILETAQTDVTSIPLAKKALGDKIRGFFRFRIGFLAQRLIEGLVNLDSQYWNDAVVQLKAALKYDIDNEQDKNLVKELLRILEPKNLTDQFALHVQLYYVDIEDLQGDILNAKGINETERFAEKLVQENIDLEPHLSMMQSGSQSRGFVFGRKLGELKKSEVFAKQCLKVLMGIPPNVQNPEMIAAYISTLSRPERKSILNLISESSQLLSHYFFITRVQSPDYNDLNSLFRVVTEEKISIKAFYQFAYGKGLDNLTDQEVLSFLEKINNYCGGPVVAFELSIQISGKRIEIGESLRSLIRKILIENNFFLIDESNSIGFNYQWHKTVDELLQDNQEDIELIHSLIDQFIDVVKEKKLNTINDLKALVVTIMRFDFLKFWDLLGPLILNNDLYQDIRFYFEPHHGSSEEESLLAYGQDSVIIDWCKQNIQKGSLRVVAMMPILNIRAKDEWHPLAIQMIDNFGSHPEFLDRISNNIASFSSFGSAIPYFENQICLAEKLLVHPINEVRSWAKKRIKSLKSTIEREKFELQNRSSLF